MLKAIHFQRQGEHLGYLVEGILLTPGCAPLGNSRVWLLHLLCLAVSECLSCVSISPLNFVCPQLADMAGAAELPGRILEVLSASSASVVAALGLWLIFIFGRRSLCGVGVSSHL